MMSLVDHERPGAEKKKKGKISIIRDKQENARDALVREGR